jgi:TonB family protein
MILFITLFTYKQLKQIVMKKEKCSVQLTKSSRILMILLTAFLFAGISCAKTTDPGKAGSGSVASQPPAASTTPDTVYVYVDQMPLFPDGDTALLKFIAENTVYPESAKKNNITGKVIVKFVVGKDCMVSDVSVLQGVEPSLDAEAIRVIKSLPKFEKPAISNGKPVAVWYMVPITYALN